MRLYIKNKVKTLVKLHNTKNIYKLCDIYNIFILYINFKNQKGLFYIDENKNHFICINHALSDEEKKYVIIHEFAHYILHNEKLLHR